MRVQAEKYPYEMIEAFVKANGVRNNAQLFRVHAGFGRKVEKRKWGQRLFGHLLSRSALSKEEIKQICQDNGIINLAQLKAFNQKLHNKCMSKGWTRELFWKTYTFEEIARLARDNNLQTRTELSRFCGLAHTQALRFGWLDALFPKHGHDLISEQIVQSHLAKIALRTDIKVHLDTVGQATDKARFSCLANPEHPDFWQKLTHIVGGRKRGCLACAGNQPHSIESMNAKLAPKGLFVITKGKSVSEPATLGCKKCGGEYRIGQLRFAHYKTHHCPLCPNEEALAQRKARETLKLARQAIKASPLRKRRKRLVRWIKVARKLALERDDLIAIDPDFYVARTDNRMRFQCLKDATHNWDATNGNISTGIKSGCPKCNQGGYDPSKKGRLYIHRVYQHEQLIGIKVGITNVNSKVSRLWHLTYRNHSYGIRFENIYERDGDGELIFKLEQSVKQKFKHIGLSQEEMFDGRKEVYALSDFDSICQVLGISLTLDAPIQREVKDYFQKTSPTDYLTYQKNLKNWV